VGEKEGKGDGGAHGVVAAIPLVLPATSRSRCAGRIATALGGLHVRPRLERAWRSASSEKATTNGSARNSPMISIGASSRSWPGVERPPPV